MDNISKHISYAEAIKSQEAIRTGIPNIPTVEHLIAMKLVAIKCFEPLREWFGKPITINSFYRNPQINIRIGGSKTSQHCTGEAIDIDADAFNKQLFNWLKDNIEFDQLIWEYGSDDNPAWIHISYSSKNNRKQILRASKAGSSTKYTLL